MSPDKSASIFIGMRHERKGPIVLNKRRKWVLLSLSFGLFILLPLIIYVSFPNTTKLVISLATHTLPDSSHISRIRNDLLEQADFTNLLKNHEQKAVYQYRQTGETSFIKKYIHKTPTSMFDIHAFHDYWEVWIRTDIFEGRPLTSFLIRLGLIRDKNAETFFSNQCKSNICKKALKSAVVVYNKMFDWGFFQPIRLNITESDETSNVSRHRMTLTEWNELVTKMNKHAKIQ